ncbi:hypothetical protein C1645_829198 [Glomus cerebriforme]|uniref:Uncharacterized protein n=1 Tax=Glomus cerebriforme TaxID=658196 RepID=A0A397SRB2_9GLOM|nr:hypothetical protein C1645_829198 [Glomus cerebriforme]
MSQTYVILIETGSLVENLHYGPFSRYWWELPSVPNLHTQPRFPIRVGQKTNACLNGCDFYTTVQISSSNQMLPEYYCQSGNFLVTETSATKAISEICQNIFQTKTQYSGAIIMEWNDKKIIDILSTTVNFCLFTCKLGKYEIFIYGLGSSTHSDWNKAGNGYKSSIIYPYKKRSAIFVSEIEDNKCYIHIYQDFKLQKTFVDTTPDAVWKNSGYIRKFSGRQLFGLEDEITLQKLQKIFVPQCASHEWSNFKLMKKIFEYHLQQLNSELKLLYPFKYQFSECELGAWSSILCAVGCSNIMPWSCNESKYQFWTKSQNPINFLVLFSTSFGDNKKTNDRKH